MAGRPPVPPANRRQRRAARAKSAADPTTPEIRKVLEAALAEMTRGAYADADRMFNRVLDIAPRNPDALHFRGLLAYRIGNLDAARNLIGQAARLAPKSGEIMGSLALVLEAAGDQAGAGRAFRGAIKLQPANAEIRNNYGAFLRSAGALEEAEAEYRKALSADPAFVPALGNLGAILYQTGRVAEASLALRQALELDPENLDTLMDFGIVLQAECRFDEAEAAYRKILAVEPHNPAAHINLASLFFEWERMEDALPHAESGVRGAPNHPAAHNNLGNVLGSLGRAAEAEAAFRQAIALDPRNADALGNLGHLLKEEGRLEEALSRHQEALAMAPGNPRYRFGLSLTLMGLGRLGEAVPHHDAGFDCGERRPDRRAIAAPWKGETLDGRTLLLWPEQGIGDEIRHASALPDLLKGPAADGKVIIECDPRLVTAFQRSFPGATVRAEGETAIESGWLQASLGQAFDRMRTDLADFEAAAPYLQADTALQAKWRDRLAALPPGRKIGLAWRSGLVTARRGRRITRIQDWEPLLTVPGIQLVALQYGDIAEEAAWVEEALGVTLHRWDDTDLRDDLDDVIALASVLDGVCSIANSVADIAASTGTQTLVATQERQWVMFGTDRLPCYPAATVFTRRADGNWAEPIGQIARYLNET